MAVLRLLLLSTILAAWNVQGGIIDLKAAQVVRRATTAHTSYRTTAGLPTQTGLAANCNKFYDIVTGDNCETVEAAFQITKGQFLAWNPAVSDDCVTNFWVGDSYCVGTAAGGVSSTKSSTKSVAPHTTVHSTADLPTQSGSICNCNKWYDVVAGDTCATIENTFGITLAQFLKWNPAVSSDCATNFWTGDSYCVGTTTAACPTSTSKTTISHTSPTISSTYSILSQITSSYVPATIATATSWPPTHTQAGQVAYCNNWDLVSASDTCDSIQGSYSTFMSMDDFISWNPAIGVNCTGLYVNYYVCVGIQYQTSAIDNSTATSYWYPSYTPTTAPTLNTSFVASPTQTGIPPSCLAFYQASANDTCETIVEKEGYVTLDELNEYNPALGSDCSGLIPGDYYCVMNGTLPLPSVATVAPTATQTGIVSTCVSWYRADSGDNCQLVVEIFGTFSAADFLTWNPAVLSDCSGFTVGDYYCVAIPSTPTTRTTSYSSTPLPSNGVGPQPEQPGIPAACADYWFVGTLDTCDSIATKNNITVAQLESYNPALGSDCSGLTQDYYICVGKPDNSTTSTTALGTTTGSIPNTQTSAFSSSTTTPTSSPCRTVLGIVSPTPSNAFCGVKGSSIAASGAGTLIGYVTGSSYVTSLAACSSQCLATSCCTNIYFIQGKNCNLHYGPNAFNYNVGSTLFDFYDATCFTCGAIGCTTAPSTTTSASLTNTGAPGIVTPSPVQPNMVSGCERFYYVESGDGCYNLAAEAGIPLNSFYSYNPAVKTDCTGLQAHVYVCIGLNGPATTITTGTPVPVPSS